MNAYQLENERLKTLYATGNWRHSGTESERIRLGFVNEHASAILLARWLDGKLTWRKLWRIAGELPGDTEAQLKELEKKSCTAKKRAV